jgi:hypothetical protein
MDEGRVLSIKPISQDTSTQWKLLLRCPFKYEHVLGIIEALEKEQARSKIPEIPEVPEVPEVPEASKQEEEKDGQSLR